MPKPPLHTSNCAMHNMPALPNGPCDCGEQLRVERRYVAWLVCLACNEVGRWKRRFLRVMRNLSARLQRRGLEMKSFCQCSACCSLRPRLWGHAPDCSVHVGDSVLRSEDQPLYNSLPCDCGASEASLSLWRTACFWTAIWAAWAQISWQTWISRLSRTDERCASLVCARSGLCQRLGKPVVRCGLFGLLHKCTDRQGGCARGS